MDQASHEVDKELKKTFGYALSPTAAGCLKENTSPDTAYLVFGLAPFTGLPTNEGVASKAEDAILYIDSDACNRVRPQGFYHADTDSTFLPRHIIQAEDSLIMKITNQLTVEPNKAPQSFKIKLGSIPHVFDTAVYVHNYKGHHESLGEPAIGIGGALDLLECSKPLCFNPTFRILR
jgi:hypothetical protein